MNILVIGSRGPWVELLQSILKRIGFYRENVDGVFGRQTQNSVQWFQQEFGLKVDSIVGKDTWDKLLLYINGRTGNIVPTDISYSYDIMRLNLEALKLAYPFLDIDFYGESVMGKKLPYVKIGRGEREVFYSATIHANEWINTVLIMKFIEKFSLAYTNNTEIYGKSARGIFDYTTMYIVPMANPDGVDLVLRNIPTSSKEYMNAFNISREYYSIPFPNGWKANILGVDLNLQFPAGWENAREIKYAQGFTTPAPRDFVGFGPLTAPESLAVYNFTLAHNFSLIIAYHTQGEEIYWQFQDYAASNALPIAEHFSEISGYAVGNVPYTSSFAGYKDWFLQKYRRPGYTIEAGLGENPLPISQFNQIYEDNIGILVLGMIL